MQRIDGYEPSPRRAADNGQRIALALGGLLVLALAAIAAVVLTLAAPPEDPAVAAISPTPFASLPPAGTTSSPTHELPTAPATEWPVLTAPPSVTPPPSAPTPLSTSAPPTDDSGKTPPPATATPAPDQPTPSPVPPPTNDDMGRALAIGSLPASHSLDTAGATTAVGDPDCDGTGPTVWFSFRPSTSMTVAATTFGSDYDTTLYAGTRSPSGGFEMLACNDDAGQNLQSALRLNVAANHTYLFMVGSYGGWESGQLVFNLQVAPLQPVVTLTLAEQGTFDTQGRATLSGTAACSSRIDGLYLEISLRQRVGRQVFRGWGESALERCGTRTRSWSALIHPDEGTFGDEPATANVYARYCDDFECRSVAFEQQVTLSSTEPPPSPSPSPAPATPSTAPEQTPMTEPSAEPDE